MNPAANERIEIWWCPTHGQVSEGDLIEGRDPSAASASDPDGWTDTYYCPVTLGDLGGEGEGECSEECTLRVFVPERA